MLDPSDVEIVNFLESVIGLTGGYQGEMAVLRAIASKETADHQNFDEFLDEVFEQTTQNLSKPKQEEENVN